MLRRSLAVLPLLLALACPGEKSDPLLPDAGLPDAPEDGGGADAGPECRRETFPAPTTGRCEAVIVDDLDDPTLPVGDDGEDAYVVPGARRVLRVGRHIELPGFPMSARRVADSPFAIVSDGGVDLEQLSVVNLDTGAVVDQRTLRERSDEALFLGLAATSTGDRVFVSGGGSNLVRVYDFDTATGQLTDAPSIRLATDTSDGYVSSLALLDDDRTLVATLMFGNQLVVYDVVDGEEVRRVSLPNGSLPYGLVVAPHTGPSDATAYVSLWSQGAVTSVEIGAGTAGTPIPVGKNPEGLALSADGSLLVVADSDSDSLSIVDTATRMRTRQLFLQGETAPRGSSPSAGTFSPDGTRFYAVSAGENAIDVFATADWTRIGRVPTMWYPTDVRALDDGRLVVVVGKHEGTGANTDPSRTDILDLVGGSVAVIAPEELGDEALARWDLEIARNNDRATRFHRVDCPDGAEDDFPIPQPGAGPSPRIRHVILVVRENKTYDAYFGDLTDASGAPHGNGDPSLVLIPSDRIEQVVPNTRELARTFALPDNYYSLAEQSVQGHVWTTMGRTTDFIERSWLTTWGRGFWTVPPAGIQDYGYPEEGSAFDWLVDNGITATNYGEIVSSRALAPNASFPGVVYNMGVPDVDKVRFLERRWQRTCALNQFTYVLLPNDHTFGGQPGRPTPSAMIADNDAAIGALVDAISHSSFWPETAVFIIQDDPQDGGDHVDNHRAPTLVISPWVKRGYVSSVHYNESSIWRTIQLILGVETPLNAYWANAAPMYDLFTSTPDFTPYEAIPRRWPEENNPGGTRSSFEAQSMRWDFSVPDEQPGLSRALWRHFHGTDAPWGVSRDELLEALEEEAEGDADGDVDEGVDEG
ncbi:MAG: bifunctional YncE family protein/alkaline phosphatase family protein [Sandaracinus sp.]|nr:bifunctional YncE family protein/alkaline phosphatase family protein [Sandaracinus sp.]